MNADLSSANYKSQNETNSGYDMSAIQYYCKPRCGQSTYGLITAVLDSLG